MSTMDKIWDALTTVIKMNDRIEQMAVASVAQQAKIEDLTGRIIRLETALEIALMNRGRSSSPQLPPGKRR